MKFFGFAFILYSVVFLTACGSDRGEKFKNLTPEQREIAYEREKKNIIDQLICSQFGDEIQKYKLDRKKKEFSPYHQYFYEYPLQFEQMKSRSMYELYEVQVRQLLQLRGIRGYDPSFRNWSAPNLFDLPCGGVVEEWLGLKREWGLLQKTMPQDFYKQDSIWDDISYYFDRALEALESGFFALLAFLLIAAITIYSIALHYAALLKNDKEGWWLIVATPLSALYWQKHISLLFGWSLPLGWKVLLTSLILSPIYFLIALAFRRLFAPKGGDLERAIEKSDLKGVARILDWDKEVINKFNDEGLSPLHLLCLKKNENSSDDQWIAAHLIKKGADVNLFSNNKDAWAPIHCIAAQGVDTKPSHLKILDVLLKSGASVEAKTPLGWTPLHLVALNGANESMGVLETLIAHRANPFATADDGITTWRMLWQHGEEVFEALDQYEKRYENGK